MAEATRRSLKEGAQFGLVAGIIFGVVQILGSLIGGFGAIMPFRMAAGIVLGQATMETASPGAVIALGTLIHLVLAAVFGLLYGLLNARVPTPTQTDWGKQAGLGVAFGAVLWIVNFQIIARIFFPWFLEAPQFLQLLAHALVYGLPLGLMYAGAERRVHRVQRQPRHA
jgi:hypothetical protein